MNNIALLMGDTVIYWNDLIVLLGIIAGGLFVFALRPFTRVKKKALLLWYIPAFFLSLLFARLLYYYCNPEQISTFFGDSSRGLFDNHFNVMGVIGGTVLAAVIIRRFQLVKHTANLLDTTFPGVILAIAVIRLNYLFTDGFHSILSVSGPFWQRFPFAVRTTDAAGNPSFVFAPFFISFVVLLAVVLVLTLVVRKHLKHPGDLFRLTLALFALSEIVLESTRYDSPKVHFLLLSFLNEYVGFISFSMFVCGICLLVLFLLYYFRTLRKEERPGHRIHLIVFFAGFICFGVIEYLLQRYTTSAVLFHWLQALFALIMGVCITTMILAHNKGGQLLSMPLGEWGKQQFSKIKKGSLQIADFLKNKLARNR